MLMAFSLNRGVLEQMAINAAADLGPEVIWVDVINPTEEERDWIRVAYAQELPTIDDLYEIEASLG